MTLRMDLEDVAKTGIVARGFGIFGAICTALGSGTSGNPENYKYAIAGGIISGLFYGIGYLQRNMAEKNYRLAEEMYYKEDKE